MIIVSGMRPTGALHIGHLFGTLQRWVELQNSKNDCYFFVADWHALTSEFKNTSSIRENSREMALDWLSAGMDPAACTIFLQSEIKEHAELFLLLSQITPLGWLERCPTYKEMKQENPDKDLSNYGFLGYPVLQAADVLLYKAQGVPVGQDQLPHLELIREITRRFNSFYAEIFPEPQSLLSNSPKINGIDGRKMSKSFNNAILLKDSEEDTRKKIMMMITDPQRTKREIPGNPDVCTLFPLHHIFSDEKTRCHIDKECRRAGIGCVDDKKILIENMNRYLKPIREKRSALERDRAGIEKIILDGSKKASAKARATMEEVRKAMKLF